MTDTVAVALIGMVSTLLTGILGLLTAVLLKVNAVKKAADGINSALRSDNAAKDGEINRLQPSGASATPQTREDGTGAPVTIDRRTNAVSVTPPPPVT